MDMFEGVAEVELNYYEMLAAEKAATARLRVLAGQKTIASKMEASALQAFVAKLDEVIPRSLKANDESRATGEGAAP